MNFQDFGIIIAKKPLRETSSVITVFTKSHGLYSGVIREASRKSGSVYQPGNYIDFHWQARLHEHLGYAKCELIKSYSVVILFDKTKLYAFNSLVNLIKIAFHEREPHNNFFDILLSYLESLSNNFNFKNYIDVELAMLKEAGYPLDLRACAISGLAKDLKYVSPKSGKAVSEQASIGYVDKLLPMPYFMSLSDNDHNREISADEIKQAFELTTYFFRKFFDVKDSTIEGRKMFFEHLM